MSYGRFDNRISWLFARGPRSDAEVAELDAHIAEESERIRSSWSDKELERRAERAGSPFRKKFEVPVIPSYAGPVIRTEIDDG